MTTNAVNITAITALAIIAIFSIVHGLANAVLLSLIIGAIVFIATRERYIARYRILAEPDGHEYRFAYALFFVMGMFSGALDASIADFTAKFFIAIGAIYMLMSWALYELLAMGRPPNLLLSALILLGCGTSGFIGAWHIAWLATWWLTRGPPPKDLWLAPNIVTDLHIYTAITGAMLILYIITGLGINYSKKLKEIYVPNKK